MSDQLTRLVVSGVLLLHGLGHGGALAALAWIGLRPGGDTGGWSAARSWIVPSLSPGTATLVASAFWIVSLAGFVVVAGAAWFDLGEWWRALAVGCAVVSLVGIVLFFGTWPAFNAVAGLAVNIAVLVAILLLSWPPRVA